MTDDVEAERQELILGEIAQAIGGWIVCGKVVHFVCPEHRDERIPCAIVQHHRVGFVHPLDRRTTYRLWWVAKAYPVEGCA